MKAGTSTKTDAFTLSEMMIAMAVATIILAVTVTILSCFAKKF